VSINAKKEKKPNQTKVVFPHIREVQDRSSRAMRDVKQQDLIAYRKSP